MARVLMAQATAHTDRERQIGKEIKMTKKQRNIYDRWENSNDTSLWDVYKNCSAEKWSAYEHCRRRFDELDGRGFRIIGANTFGFSVGFEYEQPKYGNIIFVYITKNGEQQWDAC